MFENKPLVACLEGVYIHGAVQKKTWRFSDLQLQCGGLVSLIGNHFMQAAHKAG